MVADALKLDARVVLLARPVPAHTFESGAGQRAEALVLPVLLRSHQAQVGSPVVERVAVDVIDQLAGRGLQDEPVHALQFESAAAIGHKADSVAIFCLC